MLRWFAIAVLVGCSHPASPTKHEPTHKGSATETATNANPTPGGSGDGTVGENADRVNVKAVDARVVGSEVRDGKLKLTIALPANETELPVKAGWAGAFMKDGKPLPDTDFKVTSIKGKTAFGELTAGKLPSDKVPSETVRLYEAGNRSMLDNG